MSAIKDLMGYSNIRTIMNVYGSPVDAALRKADSKIVQMVNSAGKAKSGQALPA